MNQALASENQPSWLSSLRKGDRVVVESHIYGSTSIRGGLVERVTPTQLVVNGDWFSKADGLMIVVSDYDYRVLLPLDAKMQLVLRNKELAVWLSELSSQKLPLSMLEALHAAYQAELAKGR